MSARPFFSFQRFFICMLVIVPLSLGALGCGGGGAAGDDDDDDDDATQTGSATLSGTLYQPNGTDPMPGALVYMESSSSGSGSGLVANPSRMGNFGQTLTVGTDCDAFPSGVTIGACTDADGTFTFTITDCSEITFTATASGSGLQAASLQGSVKWKNGSALGGTLTVTIACSSAGTQNDIPATETTASGTGSTAPTIAVCRGSYDKMEHVLGRMGYAPSDTDPGNGWNGSVTENFNYFVNTTTSTTYPSCCDLLQGDTVAITDSTGAAVNDSSGTALSRTISDYDIVFLNCGISACETDLTSGTGTTVSTLQTYVSGGGALYVTDLSYDFVEQAFPDKMDYGASGSGTTAETLNAAQVGISGAGGEPILSTVNETTLINYLKSVSSANTACGTPDGTGSLMSGDTQVNICDFLSGWGLMIGKETGSNATVWIKGAAAFSGGPYTNAAGETVTSGTTLEPLTITFESGTGAVLYSSYHTDNSSTLTTDFLPQERILQFLVLEIFSAI